MELKDIIVECNKLANSLNADFDLPVKINKRLTRTLGRVCFQGGVPYVMEFSDSMLKTCTHESIMEVIKHEFGRSYLSHFPTETSSLENMGSLKKHLINFHGHTHSKLLFEK